ncbi:MAG TPA: alpha/beta hydrolase-fold protein [Phycisphaerales bacterium]|nr:alpha/beta hydrolase-fold protein [Phycisphaerales bacterium]
MKQTPMRTFLIIVLSVASTVACRLQADTYTVMLDAELSMEPASGRIILFFITEQGREWTRRSPIEGPFFSSPQPIASIAVENFKPGDRAAIDDGVFTFPVPLNQLSGIARVQAIFDHDQTERSHEEGPGNVYSDVLTIELSPEREDSFELVLKNVVKPSSLPAESANLKWVEVRSEMLSEFYGRDVFHRAGIALPPGYDTRAEWPALYVIPGYGGRHTMARMYERMFASPGVEDVAPLAVTIVLDPESPLGHHGFVDSPNHGPRGTALVREFIPYLESQFKLASRLEARALTGHSSGGWTSFWLQLQWPDVFGACWSSAPDPIDFRAFQMTDIYKDASMYEMPDGSPTPSYRVPGPDGTDRVAMTVKQEMLMEYAIHPLGGSGQQWDAWKAMFSPRDQATGYPRRLFNPLTGEINRDIAHHWKQFDIGAIVRSDWEHYGPIVLERIRLACGERDSYYLQRAVRLFKEDVERLAAQHNMLRPDKGGYVFLHEHATHGSIMNYTFARWNREMRAYFQSHGLHD